MRLPRLAICGPGRAGKDELATYLRLHTPLRHPGAMSIYLCPHVASRKWSVPLREVIRPEWRTALQQLYAMRHQERELWYEEGNRLRQIDRAVLVRPAMRRGHLLVGCRDGEEITYALQQGIVDLAIWVHNPRVSRDPTLKYGREVCQVVIENDGTLPEYHTKIRSLVRALRLPWKN